MFNLMKDRNFIGVRDDGKEISGNLDEALFIQIKEAINRVKTDDDNIKEKLDKVLDKLNERISDEEKLANIELYPKLENGLKIIKGRYYRHIHELFKAKDTFIYDNQMTPILTPDKWKKIETKQELSEYEKNYNKATFWNRDETFDEGTYVIWYKELYLSKQKIVNNEEPGTGKQWIKIPKE